MTRASRREASPIRRVETSLKRKVETRVPRKTITVFCEGKRSEPEYLEALRRLPEVRDVASVDIRVDYQGSGAVPLTLVRRAAEAKERVDGEDGEVDEFWCIFDVECPIPHPNLVEAVDIANRKGIHTAITNPCFELWLILHFQGHGAYIDNDAARRLRRSLDGQIDKGVVSTQYMSRIRVASRRAKSLDRNHERNDTRFPQNNPSSGMHKFVTSVLPPNSTKSSRSSPSQSKRS